MGFCSFSSETIIENKTTIDNIFINEFLPYAPDFCVKVYLYGLYKCSNSTTDNDIESFARVLKCSEEDIEQAFLYWQEQGLVQILKTCPFSVKYMPPKNCISNNKKYNKEKYASFNIQIQELLSGRMITPTEYHEYYDFMESFKVEPEALIMIVGYATQIKGDNVGYNYILTVAKNWAYEGVKNSSQVEEKLKEFELNSEEIGELTKIFGIKRIPSIEEKEYLLKWKNDFGFDFETIKFVAKNVKKQYKSGFDKLDKKLLSYYEKKLTSKKEIEEYEQNKEALYAAAKEVCKNLGIYYENLEPVIDNYISTWTNMGYDSTTLSLISNFAFKSNVRNLENLEKIILKFYKLGLISKESIDEHLTELLATDKKIKEILNCLGLSRQVNSFDREFYNTWINVWKMPEEVIQYAGNLASDKLQPMQYINKVLSNFYEKDIKTLEEAQKFVPESQPVKKEKKIKQNFEQRTYKKEELNALYDSIEEIEI